jgi:L-threonylcarbamoyladenylate synthase
MRCEVLQVDAVAPEAEALARAAEVLRRGGLVAFPTETVYGLGANALDAAAVERIFVAKGRPAHNPLIVHVADAAAVGALVSSWPESAQRLAERFWPGPLTLVLPRSEAVPDLVTAGGPTVALRMPAHPVALALLRTFGPPIAAPSANRSMQLSPTRGEHVLAGLGDQIDLLLDAGPTPGGLESTVLDLTVEPPCLLRPGLISPPELLAVIRPIQRADSISARQRLRSPGQMERHYAPRTPLELWPASSAFSRVLALAAQGLRVGWLMLEDLRAISGPLGAAGTPMPVTAPVSGQTVATQIGMPGDPVAYAAALYHALHQFDALGLNRIVVDLPPVSDEWLAVDDRLRRAAARE